jgi:hypothetical protein
MTQDLGEGPDQVLVGTFDGCICLSERADQPHPVRWTLVDQAGPGDRSMAATDQVVVAGYKDGDMWIFRMDVPNL